ncbi:MAG: 50S ribosomal protein L25 [Bacteroidales bacterium]
MKTISLSGSLRENVGKKDVKHLRTQGLVPCVVYGGKAQIHFSIPEKTLAPLFATPEVCYVEIEVNGQKYLTLPQDVQFHKVTETILHVDFFELNNTRTIRMAVPLLVEGSSPGVLKGGKLVKNLRKIKVRALPKHMPEQILVNISKLEVGDQVRVRDMKTDNYDFIEAPSTTVVLIKSSRNMTDDAVATPAAAAAPAAAAPAAEKKPAAKK